MPRAARNTWRGADPAGAAPTQETPTPGLHHAAPKHCQRGTPKTAPRPKNPGSLQPCARGCSRPKVALVAGAGTSGTRRGVGTSWRHRGAGEGRAPPPHPGPGGELPVRSLQRGNAEAPPAPQGPPGRPCSPAPQGRYRLRGGAGSGPALPQPPGCCLTDSLSIFETTGFHFEAILPVRN